MSKETTITENKKRPRKKLLSQTGPLSCKSMPGFHLRWHTTNDPQSPMNIQEALDRGYTFVTPAEQGIDINSFKEDLSSAIDNSTSDRVIRTGRDGINSVLMKLPLEFYHEDLEELRQHNDAQVAHAVKPKKVNGVGLPEFGESIINGKKIN